MAFLKDKHTDGLEICMWVYIMLENFIGHVSD